MNAQYFAALITIILTTGLSQPVTQIQTQEFVLTSMLNDVFVPRSPKSQSQQKASEPPSPPDRGAPGGRTGGATRNAFKKLAGGAGEAGGVVSFLYNGYVSARGGLLRNTF